MGNPWQAAGGVVKRHCKTGEPDALKGASPVRRGAVGNVITTVRMWITRAGRLPDLVGTFPRSEPAMRGGYCCSPRRRKREMWAIHPVPYGMREATGMAPPRKPSVAWRCPPSAFPCPLRWTQSRGHATFLSLPPTRRGKIGTDFQSKRSVTNTIADTESVLVDSSVVVQAAMVAPVHSLTTEQVFFQVYFSLT